MGTDADAYDRSRRRVDALVRDLDADALATPVAACPGWSVADLVAHLSAITVDVADGNIDGVGTDAYTARQVFERADQPIALTLDQWAEHAPALTGAFESFPFEMAAGPAVGDVYTHEIDLRFALGRRSWSTTTPWPRRFATTPTRSARGSPGRTGRHCGSAPAATNISRVRVNPPRP
ncbi:MAG: maleylpyruvate isomerase family mycothiol-dependent enzyme [Acidimicrobiia bacterium]|nr:maleylpyruvate isomerase family mycothiol-dependent enzyme [Acidimicrobiia bacterium]